MKLIIECSEQTYSECKKISGLSITAFVIAHGTPYNPTGDLISREALKEQINATDFDCGDFYDNTEIIRESVCNAIDNAQAISLPNEQIISDIPKDYLYDTETEEFYVYRNKYTGKEIHIVKNPPAYILDKRPQGEQIAWEQGYEAGLAQAVEITEEQAINKLHETGWLIGHDKEMTERPQGEWVLVHPLQENDEGAYMCSVCHTGDWCISPKFKFCPYCGADMKGGAE